MNRVAWVVVVLGGLTAVSSILASVFGARAILLAVGSTIFTIAAARGAFKLQARRDRKSRAKSLRWQQENLRRQQEQLKLRQQRQQQEQLERQQELRRGLDRDCAGLLQRAEGAVKAILASDARAEDFLNPPVDEELLRENVQGVLSAGVKLTDLRARQRSITARNSLKSEEPPRLGNLLAGLFGGRAKRDVGTPGPMTAAVLEPQKQALAMVLRSVTSRVENLECCASSVKAVGATYRDWIGAQEAERLNELVRDALAETVRDKLAVEEFRRLAERAAVAEQAFRHSIDEANLAAEILVLPDDGGS